MNDERKPLERRLAEADFSDQSVVRETLGRELQRRIDDRETDMNKRYSFPRRFDMFIRRPVPAFGLGIFVALAVLLVAHPDGRAALAKLTHLFQVGEHTYIHEAPGWSDAQLDSVLMYMDERREKGETVFQMTPYGGYGGGVPQGADPYIKEVGSLSLAAGMTDYPLLVPTYFNERIPPRLRFQKAVILPDGSTMLYFGVGPLETMISLARVGGDRSVGYTESRTEIAEDGTRTTVSVTPELEEIEVAGKQVVWQVHSEGMRQNLGGLAVKIPDKVIGRFLWEQDGLSCSLNGKFLTKEEGIKIIESLRLLTAGN
ncbi:MAG: hypothetical protein ABFS42_14495 [Candidatus Krumholzibacteriota bacterium]